MFLTNNRKRIDKYGFWGLIVFVWIPFMASGVLVGAMLGLVARMRFQRVLAACFIGGTAASITWAYTARGIIEVMHKYHAEAFIPFILLLAVGFTWLKIRDNKRFRREELFKDQWPFSLALRIHSPRSHLNVFRLERTGITWHS